MPITAVADLTAAAEWWPRFGVPGSDSLLVLPWRRTQAGQVRPASAAGRPLAEVTDPFDLEVHRPVQADDAAAGAAGAAGVRAARARRAAGGGGAGGGGGRKRDRGAGGRVLDGQDPGVLGGAGAAAGAAGRGGCGIRSTRPARRRRCASCRWIGPRTVVWLNEAQLYLDVAAGGLGERVAAGLRELLRDPARAPVLVLATLWPEFWDRLTARPAGGGRPACPGPGAAGRPGHQRARRVHRRPVQQLAAPGTRGWRWPPRRRKTGRSSSSWPGHRS